ncbi:hypothetical protein GJ496_000978 [Pomphorhynchus laevis]|nr:hypothetical protein GJ496_000978 [Pomphorhynchus laevis]
MVTETELADTLVGSLETLEVAVTSLNRIRCEINCQMVNVRKCSVLLHDIFNSTSPIDNLSKRLRANERKKKTDKAENVKIKNFCLVEFENFDLLKTIGIGGSGKVFLARYKPTFKLYAIKALRKSFITKNNCEQNVITERRILELGYNHPFLCSLFCSFQTNNHLFLVMDYYPGGDFFCGAQVYLAISYLHQHGVLYRDLKLDNMLIDRQGNCVITDFGMCKEGISNDNLTSTFCGTAHYMAPEVLKRQKYGFSVDWWNFGVVIYQLLIGCNPFEAFTTTSVFDVIMSTDPHIPDCLTGHEKDIIKSLLIKDPQKRLGCSRDGSDDIKYHQFFKYAFNWDDLENMKLKSPLKPVLLNETDTSNFEASFTKIPPKLFRTYKNIVGTVVDQSAFVSFSFQR